MSPSSSTAPAPFDQAELDRLYWSLELKVADIAERFGLSGNRLSKLATPFATHLRCLLCDGVVVATSRAQLDQTWLKCGVCGAARRQREHRYDHQRRQRLAAVAAEELESGPGSIPTTTVLVRRRLNGARWDLGVAAQSAVDGLESIGRPWAGSGRVLVLEPHDGIDEIEELLCDVPAGTIGVDRLSTLGDSQTEALQALFQLTRAGLRIVSGDDVEIRGAIGCATMDTLAAGDLAADDDDWIDDDPVVWDRLAFADRVINATARFSRG